ncbi:hypothetical protein Tco_0209471 [Tanacetum coccineum]
MLCYGLKSMKLINSNYNKRMGMSFQPKETDSKSHFTKIGFMLLALIWRFDFPPFMVLIIAILNDGTIMTILKDRVKPSPLPDSWKLAEIFTTGVVLVGFGYISSNQHNQLSLDFCDEVLKLVVCERPGWLLVIAFAIAQLESIPRPIARISMAVIGSTVVLFTKPWKEPKVTLEQAAKLCDRNFRVRADGVIFAMPGSNGTDYTMRMFNSDGSEPEVPIFLIQRNRHALIGRATDDHGMKRVLEFLKNDRVVDSVYGCNNEVIGPSFFRFKAEIEDDTESESDDDITVTMHMCTAGLLYQKLLSDGGNVVVNSITEVFNISSRALSAVFTDLDVLDCPICLRPLCASVNACEKGIDHNM